MTIEAVAAILGVLGIREIAAYIIRRHMDGQKFSAETRILEKEIESKDIENRLRILDAMEERINSIIEVRARLQDRVNKLELELEIYKDKVLHLEIQEDECEKMRERLEKRLGELEKVIECYERREEKGAGA